MMFYFLKKYLKFFTQLKMGFWKDSEKFYKQVNHATTMV